MQGFLLECPGVHQHGLVRPLTSFCRRCGDAVMHAKSINFKSDLGFLQGCAALMPLPACWCVLPLWVVDWLVVIAVVAMGVVVVTCRGCGTSR